MKTSDWTRLIGILCMVFGANALMNYVVLFFLTGGASMLLLMGSEGKVPQPEMLKLVHYFGGVVSLLYPLAGWYFLKRRSFSLKLMYTALILSLLYGLVPMLVLNWYSPAPNPSSIVNVFFLMGPAIDLLLLIGVYKISRYYYEEPDHVVHLFGTGALSEQQLKWITIAGLLCLLVPVSIFGLWIYVTSQGLQQAEAVALFHQYLPEMLRTRFGTAYLSLFCCIPAIVFSFLGINMPDKGWRVINIVVMVLSFLLFGLNLFTMM